MLGLEICKDLVSWRELLSNQFGDIDTSANWYPTSNFKLYVFFLEGKSAFDWMEWRKWWKMWSKVWLVVLYIGDLGWNPPFQGFFGITSFRVSSLRQLQFIPNSVMFFIGIFAKIHPSSLVKLFRDVTNRPGPPILVAFWFREMGPRKFQGKSRLVNYHSIWPEWISTTFEKPFTKRPPNSLLQSIELPLVIIAIGWIFFQFSIWVFPKMMGNPQIIH